MPKQPVKGNVKANKKPVRKKKTLVSNGFRKRKPWHKQYGTSQLEKDFAHLFLDPIGANYVYQYEARDIGRFFDFAVTDVKSLDAPYLMENKDGITCIKQYGAGFVPSLLIEVDGGYYHSDPRLVKEGEMNRMQRRNKKVDAIKDEWAALHGIPILRIWEYDIRHSPDEVKRTLKNYIGGNLARRKKRTVPFPTK